MTATVVDVAGLEKTYRNGHRALSGVTFSVPSGRVLGLIGRNGAGKTTMIGILSTRLTPSEGTAVVAGLNVADDPVEVRSRIGCVSQINSLDRSLTGREGLYFHCRYFGWSRRAARGAVRDTIERFDLAAFCDRLPDELSGGEARRLQIARAVVHDPDVLFLDEPTTGLDTISRQTVWAMVLELRRAGKSVLLCTHDLAEAAKLSDELLVIDQGTVRAQGKPERIAQLCGSEQVVVGRVDGGAHLVAAAARGQGIDAWETGIDEVRFLPERGDPLRVFGDLCERAGVRALGVHVEPADLDLLFRWLAARDAQVGLRT